MPIAPVDAAQAYQDLVLNAGPAIGLNSSGQASYKGLKGRVNEQLSSRTAAEQFTFDCALWYGYLEKLGGTAWKKNMCKRIFSVLYWGGLMCQRDDDQWVSWASQEAPICSTISHTARILVLLPENDDNQAFWEWLWVGENPEGRAAATHGIEALPRGTNIGTMGAPVFKIAKELKKNRGVSHFGVNIALGGVGNTNPISGKGIRENGKHGHLYLAYMSNTIRTPQGPRRALLLGTEQSSPIDRQVAVQGKAGKLKSIFRGIDVPDQYGGGHGLGGHSRFSATGGDDFAYTWKERTGAKTGIFRRRQKEVHTGNLSAYGPAVGYYYDGLYLDLTVARFTRVMREARNFTSAMVGQAGEAPS